MKFNAKITGCIGFLGILCLLICWLKGRDFTQEPQEEKPRDSINQEVRKRVLEIQSRESNIAQTLWSDEYQAQSLGRSIEHWWDRINASQDKLSALAETGPEISILVGEWAQVSIIDQLGIEIFNCINKEPILGHEGWNALIHSAIRQGWQLDQIEFRHLKYNPPQKNQAAHSEYFFRAGLSNTKIEKRILLTGPLEVEWNHTNFPAGDVHQIRKIDATSLEIRSLNGLPPFQLIHQEKIPPPNNSDSIDPLLVHDLDGDGISEIVLANKNQVFKYQQNETFVSSPLCTFPPGLITTAVFADLNHDGHVDLLCHKHEGLVVLPGADQGLFDQFEIMIRPSDSNTRYPMVLSVGDIDGDHDLDVFLGQYRVPYQGGSLPTPFYDANDGWPFYLLRNNGDWNFEDITEQAIPDGKRKRRVYSGSFVDLDEAKGLDLVVISDFAGTDLYLNDGEGIFHPSGHLLGDAYGFGMAHTFSDFNVDGKLDLLMIGMTSPTVDRLEHFELWREGLTQDRTLRSRLAQGNRLFLSDDKQGFMQNGLSQSIARAGWAWGCSSADFDNDGYPDVMIGNGLETRKYVQDYESEYWLHDAFVADSEPDTAAYLYFEEKFGRTRGKGHSYGGYESNRLFLNQQAESFLDIGYLWGLGLQRDTRNVVTEDFDGDGRMDCLFTHYEVWPDENQILSIYKNKIENSGNWIGFRFKNLPNVPSPIGATIKVISENSTQMNAISTGDSYRSQHSQSLHFGLGEDRRVKTAIVRWPDGEEFRLDSPQVNRYHSIVYEHKMAINGME